MVTKESLLSVSPKTLEYSVGREGVLTMTYKIIIIMNNDISYIAI